MHSYNRAALLAGLRRLAKDKRTPPKLRMEAIDKLIEFERSQGIEPSPPKLSNAKRIKELADSCAN